MYQSPPSASKAGQPVGTRTSVLHYGPAAAGIADYARGFRTIAEAMYLRDHIIRQLELASVAADPAERPARCTFAVVGAGYTGTEVTAHGDSGARILGRTAQAAPCSYGVYGGVAGLPHGRVYGVGGDAGRAGDAVVGGGLGYREGDLRRGGAEVIDWHAASYGRHDTRSSIAARRMQAAARVSGRPGDDAPDLAIGPRLTPGCAQAGTPARTAASVRSPKPRMSVMRPPLTVRTCQRWAVPPASRAAGVPVTSSPTRSVPGRRSPQ